MEKTTDRVAEKRDCLLRKLKGLKLDEGFDMEELKGFLSSMEQANLTGEKELANEYKKQAMLYILEHRSSLS